MENYLLELKNITKVFPGVVANDSIDLNIREGEIHAIVGENGAGKSTLMNTIYGLFPPTRGEIYYRGKKVEFDSPLDSIELGIGMVHQHFMLVPSFTVAENISLGIEPKDGLFIDKKKEISDVIKLSEEYGLYVNPNEKLGDLSIGLQQRVEILKALHRGADIIILDEPTAVLTPQETEELFVIIKKLVSELNKTIIIITHKLPEVMAISDRVSIMRDGKLLDTLNTKDVNPEILSELMVGREVLLEPIQREKTEGENILEVKNLYVRDNRGFLAAKDISFKLKSGEILGIAGIEGNGQRELVEAITGLREIASGELFVDGEMISNSNPLKMRNTGLAHVPEDRIQMGLSIDASVSDNLLMSSQNKSPFVGSFDKLNKKEIKKFTNKLIEDYDIRTPSGDTLAKNLSGGNMQKIVIAREFNFDTPILIISQPTRGVDIGAIEFIHSEIIRKRNEGAAILLLSAELEEVMRLSDRIMTIYEGEITGEFEYGQMTPTELGLYMTGRGKSNE